MSDRAFTVERRASSVTKAPLPEAARSALGSIVDDLRHAPRDVFVDRAELVHWLAKMARRVDGVAAMTVPVAGKSPSTARVRSAPVRRLTPHEVAEAVFGKGLGISEAPRVRTIISRKGRAVWVETRRARATGQLDLWT